MKKNRNILILITLICSLINAQQKENKEIVYHFPMWTLSANAGGIVPLGTFNNIYRNSFSAGVEIDYHPAHRIAFFFSPQYNFLSAKDLNFSGTAGYLELGFGTRVYFGKRPGIFFGEAGIGDYIYYLSSNNYVSGSSSNTNSYFGIKAGFGGNLPLSPKILFFIKSDFHMIFSRLYRTNYLGMYAGVRFII